MINGEIKLLNKFYYYFISYDTSDLIENIILLKLIINDLNVSEKELLNKIYDNELSIVDDKIILEKEELKEFNKIIKKINNQVNRYTEFNKKKSSINGLINIHEGNVKYRFYDYFKYPMMDRDMLKSYINIELQKCPLTKEVSDVRQIYSNGKKLPVKGMHVSLEYRNSITLVVNYIRESLKKYVPVQD